MSYDIEIATHDRPDERAPKRGFWTNKEGLQGLNAAPGLPDPSLPMAKVIPALD